MRGKAYFKTVLCPQELSKKKQKEIFQSVNNATV